jgi:hypothetical protein
MLTRRGFLCSLAALSASRVAPVPVAAAAVPSVARERLTFRGAPVIWDDELPPTRVFYRRRDDGDTILELR